MSRESAFLELLRPLADTVAARGLTDDAAVLQGWGGQIVLTHDAMAEGVHYLPDADPRDVAWKLVAVNLSDLAAKGADAVGILLGYSLGPDEAWDRAFVIGLEEALRAFDVALLGGDTVSVAAGGGRTLGITAIGRMDKPAPARSGARAGDALWLCGAVGDAVAGLDLLRAGCLEPASLVAAHRRPAPLLAQGKAVAPLAGAMMDISDGLLIDARRLALASGVSLVVVLDAIALSDAYRALHGDDLDAVMKAATGGDDYALLFTLPDGRTPPVAATRIGRCGAHGAPLVLTFAGETVPLPDWLGYEHD